MDPDALREYAARERRALADLKAVHWRDRTALLGGGEALRVADDLRRWFIQQNPGWPSAADREGDLATHIRVGDALRRVPGPR